MLSRAAKYLHTHTHTSVCVLVDLHLAFNTRQEPRDNSKVARVAFILCDLAGGGEL